MRTAAILTIVFAYMILPPTCPADLNLQPFSYHEDFESQDPFVPAWHSGNFTINFKGIVSGKSTSGSKSFKLDVTLAPNSEVEFKIPVTKIPTVGHLQFSGDLYLESDPGGNLVTLGTQPLLDPPGIWAPENRIHEMNFPGRQWVTQTSDLVYQSRMRALQVINSFCGAASLYGGATPSDMGIWTGAVTLLIGRTPNGGRVVVYVDNIRIEGNVPSAADYGTHSKPLWQAYLSRVRSDVAYKADYIVGYNGGTTDPVDAAYLAAGRSRASVLKGAVGPRGYPTPSEYQELLDLYEAVSFLPQKKQYIDSHPGQAVVPYPWQPITSKKVLPDTDPVPASPGSSLLIKACPGEYEPTSFFIHARSALSNVRVEATDLRGPGNAIIQRSAVDLRMDKAWYRAGSGTVLNHGTKTLAPELLIKDDKLVLVDLKKQTNLLRISVNGAQRYVDVTNKSTVIPENAQINDARILQPFSISQYENKHIWITVNVPKTAESGDYSGLVNIHIPGSKMVSMNLLVTVLPFSLSPALLEYGIYYRGGITDLSPAPICSDLKSDTQYRIEMQDILNHGVSYPHMPGEPGCPWLRTAFDIRRELGFPKDKLYVGGTPIDIFRTGSASDRLSAELKSVLEWKTIAANNGYKDLYVYGIDEAHGQVLEYQQDAWQLIHSLGAKVFAAFFYSGSEDALAVNDVLDLVVLDGRSPREEIRKWHDKGKKVFMYANPQSGIEDPELYRKNYGFALWCSGYDGAMPYAYQHAFGHIWNDFDDPHFRDHVFAFPVTNGVIDTVQWEGFREAVDDVRYVAALKGYMDEVDLRDWLAELISTEPTMWSVREKIIERILSFRGTIKPPNPLGQERSR